MAHACIASSSTKSSSIVNDFNRSVSNDSAFCRLATPIAGHSAVPSVIGDGCDGCDGCGGCEGCE